MLVKKYKFCIIKEKRLFGSLDMIKNLLTEIFPAGKCEKTPLQDTDRKFALKYYSLAFFLPFLIICFAAVVRGVAPFGDSTLMAIDAWGQYFPMLREMKRAFRSLDFSYSFTGALGFDMTAQSAYYTNSPLWYLLFLLPGELTPGQVDMMVFIRFALASLTFTYYLTSHSGEKNYKIIFFGLGYAFSGYTFAFINQFMWMDAVVLFPLVLLGIERLYKGQGGYILYTLSLFTTIYSNFYIAYAVCIFAVLWFFYLSFSEKKSFKEWFFAAVRFGICSLTAGILNLPVLIPLLSAISKTLASQKGFTGEFKLYHSILDLLIMLLPYGKSSLAFGQPNLYFGLFSALISVFAVFSKKISVKKKLGFVFLIAFMLLSFNFNLLDFIWHGFHFPNQLPGRQSFIFSFLGAVAAFYGFKTISDSGIRQNVKKAICMILTVFVVFELSTNAVTKFWTDTKCVDKSSVLRNAEVMDQVREKYSPDEKENEFWRTELAAHRYNGGQLHGYNGISHYSSTMSGACYNFFTKLGMSVYAKNVSIEYLPNPVLNSLFGVKYLVSDSPVPDEVSVFDGSCLYMNVHENTAVLPLFYVGEKDILSLSTDLSGYAFTNEIFKCISGSGDVISGNGVYDKENNEGYKLNKEEFLKGIESILESECTITDFGKKEIKGIVNSVKDGVLIVSLPGEDVRIEIDGKETETLLIAGYMAGAEISEGTHEITIKLP